MKNIHILPTNKPSRLGYLTKKGKEVFKDLRLFDKLMPNILDSENQHIYITSDEEIKEGEKGWLLENNSITKNVCEFDCSNGLGGIYSTDKKIILTTDPALIEDGVQAIDDEFLEWFVKNPTCEYVETEQWAVPNGYETDANGRAISVCKWVWRIKIPQEEPKQDLEKEMFELEQELDIQSSMRWYNSKPKQETLEEAAEKYLQECRLLTNIHLSNPIHAERCKNNFIAGAKWQAKRIYSEEEVYNILEQGMKDAPNEELTYHYSGNFRNLKEWFEQFSKLKKG